jgi:hypothetical protein
MQSDVDRARQELELARTMSERKWAEYSGYAKTLYGPRGKATPEEMQMMREASDWTGKIYEAEEALFKAEYGTPGVVGSHGNYQWLIKALSDITTLLRLCPDIVSGKYLAVTAIDSGTLRLTEEEKRDGWFTTGAGTIRRDENEDIHEERFIAHSPRIASIHGLPNEEHDECCEGFDEWYVFENAPSPTEIEVFVNWGDFRLYDPVWQGHIDRFWEQMERIAPESYIADGTVFTIVTSNPVLFTSILSAFSELAQRPMLL